MSVTDGKAFWTRKPPGEPEAMMPYWLSPTQYYRRGSASEHNAICEQTTEGVRLFDGLLYVPFWVPPGVIALEPATGDIRWWYR